MIRIYSRIEFVAFILITFTIAATKSQSLDCNAYTDNLGYYNPAQSCSVLDKFCCGSCSTFRFCCDDPLYSLNQTECPPSSQPNRTRSSTIIVPVSTSYQDIIKVYNTIYWIKVCLILVPIFILVILLSVAFILCSKTKKARKEEFRLIYTLPTTTLGTVPSSPFRPNFTPRPSIVNEVPKYDSINNSVLVNGAFIIQADELPKYDDFKKY